ncbi:MAG: helix-turn-helix domain-containing protein [Clostridiales bacterium]|nr:helix-turn-helix domain-containing protein [Clostridiales bacterium]
MEINERIKALRKELKMTQLEFAAKLFMTNDAISNIERGLNPPAGRTIDQICKTFNVSKEWLETGEGDTFLLPLDNDAVLLSAIAKYGNGSATLETLKALMRLYADLPEDKQKKLDRAIEAAVLAIKKDPE